jgi:hypothetical protein
MKKFTFPEDNEDKEIIPSTLKTGTVYIDSDGDLCIALCKNTYLRFLNPTGNFFPCFCDRRKDHLYDTSVDKIIMQSWQDIGKKYKITFEEIE